MKILVTGGAGFIGSNIVERLIREHNNVTVLDNFITGHRDNLAHLPDVCVIEGDVRDERAVNKAMCGMEIVFHLAASVGNKRSIEFPIDDASTNVLGTIRVLDAAVRNGTRKIVTSSSAGIYGELKQFPIPEGHPVEPDSPYGCTKLCEEKLCLSYAKMYKIEAVCLRYFNVYGPRQRFDAYGNVIPIFVFNALEGKDIVIFGDGEQTRDFVNVADVVEANIRAAMSQELSGAFNIASGRNISINLLVAMISEIIGTTPNVRHAPIRKGDVRDSLAEIGAAKKMLGYEPGVNLRDGLAEYIEWAQGRLAENEPVLSAIT